MALEEQGRNKKLVAQSGQGRSGREIMMWEWFRLLISKAGVLWACLLLILLQSSLSTVWAGETTLKISNVTADVSVLQQQANNCTVRFELGDMNRTSQTINVRDVNQRWLQLVGHHESLTFQGSFSTTTLLSASILCNDIVWGRAKGSLNETLCGVATSSSSPQPPPNYTLLLTSNNTTSNMTLPLKFNFTFGDHVCGTTSTATTATPNIASHPDTVHANDDASSTTTTSTTTRASAAGSDGAGNSTGILVGGIMGGFFVGCLVLAVGALVIRRGLESHRSHVVTKVFGDNNASMNVQRNPAFAPWPEDGAGAMESQAARTGTAQATANTAPTGADTTTAPQHQHATPHSVNQGQDAYANAGRLAAVWALLEDERHQPAYTSMHANTGRQRVSSPAAPASSCSSSGHGAARTRSESPQQRRQRQVSTHSCDNVGGSTEEDHHPRVDFVPGSSDVERMVRNLPPLGTGSGRDDDDGARGDVRTGRSLVRPTSSGDGGLVYDDVSTASKAPCGIDFSQCDDERYDEHPTFTRQATSADTRPITWKAGNDGYKTLRRGPHPASKLRTTPLRARARSHKVTPDPRGFPAAQDEAGGWADESDRRRSLYDVPRPKMSSRARSSGSSAQQSSSYDVPRVQPPPRQTRIAQGSDGEGQYRVPRLILSGHASPASLSATSNGVGRHGSMTSSYSNDGSACQDEAQPPQLPPKTRSTVTAHASTPLRTAAATTTAAIAPTAARSRGRRAHARHRPQSAAEAAAAVTERIQQSSAAASTATTGPRTGTPAPRNTFTRGSTASSNSSCSRAPTS